jgi:hypothetical protein
VYYKQQLDPSKFGKTLCKPKNPSPPNANPLVANTCTSAHIPVKGKKLDLVNLEAGLPYPSPQMRLSNVADDGSDHQYGKWWVVDIATKTKRTIYSTSKCTNNIAESAIPSYYVYQHNHHTGFSTMILSVTICFSVQIC